MKVDNKIDDNLKEESKALNASSTGVMAFNNL